MSANLVTDEISAVPSPSSSVAWPAIFAGALVAAATSLVLLILGSGLGLAIVSPWSTAGVGVTTFAVSTAIWLVVVQWLSSGLGGFITGRLRIRFDGAHPHEVFFRDTAHGLLTWALATLLVAGLMGTTLSAIVDRSTFTGVSVVIDGARIATSSASNKLNDGTTKPSDYMIDTMFRPVLPTVTGDAAVKQPPQNAAALKSEASNIIAANMVSGQVSEADKVQLASIIAMRTGMTSAEAQKRVDDIVAFMTSAKIKAQSSAEAARKAGLTLTLMTCLSLVIGAFIACITSALGGALRDDGDIGNDNAREFPLI